MKISILLLMIWSGYLSETKQITVISTAYCLTGKTSTGSPAGPGSLAVDPKIIPLQKVLYVEGYGLGKATDTGKKIKGKRIDLWFPQRKKCLEWGKRRTRVWILK